jgi:hypothetical protein
MTGRETPQRQPYRRPAPQRTTLVC